MKKFIEQILLGQSENLLKLVNSDLPKTIDSSAGCFIDCLKNKHKILICGNGGSAADAQHFAAELVGRFLMERKALPALALTTDTSIITSVANDYSYDDIFSRQVQALGRKGDIFVGISTSGNSKNIINAINAAQKKGLTIVGLLGKNGGQIAGMCDIPIVVPINQTPRVQEVHIMIIHILCELIEKELMCEEQK